MKRICKSLAAIAFIGLFSISASAQKDMFKNGFVLKLGLNMPSSTFADVSQMTVDFGGGLGSLPVGTGLTPDLKMGYALELGTHFFLNSIEFHEDMRIGIDVSWFDLNYQALKYNDVFDPIPYEGYMGNIGAKVGPSFSYSPADNMAIDVAFKWNPVFTIGGVARTTTYTSTDPVTGKPVETEFAEGFGVGGFGSRFSPSLAFRYSVLLVGFEYNMGTNDHTAVFADDRITGPDITGTNPTPLNSMRINIGFKF